MNSTLHYLSGVLGVAMSFSWCLSSTKAEEGVFAIQSRLSTPNFQLFLDFEDEATVSNPGSPLFVTAGGVYGMAFVDEQLYGIELENGTFEDFLITVEHEGAALGARVGTQSVGFPDIEALAAIDGQLYGASVEFEAHLTTLITIDSDGIGTAVGTGTFNVIVVGMAYNRRDGVLYGATIPFAGLDGNNLITIDPNTGATTLVGNMNVPIQSLAWTPNGLFGAFDRLYRIDTATAVATPIGDTEFTDGKGIGEGLFNGLYAMGALPLEIPDDPMTGATPFAITNIVSTGVDQYTVNWQSDTTSVYDLQGSASLQTDDWRVLMTDIPGEADETSRAIDKPGEDTWFVRVAKQ